MRKGVTMSRRCYAKHSTEFRDEAVRQVRGSRDALAKIARELGVNENTLRMWVRDAAPVPPPANESERSELTRLRKEVRQLRMERDILKKAAAFFAKHSS
jgi:transposase